MKKRKGFTLIETIANIAIISIIFSVSIPIYKFKTAVKNDIYISSYLYEIQSLITYGKSICKENEEYGKLVVNSKENNVKFIENWHHIEKTIQLPSSIRLVSQFTIYITPKGKLESGNTISLLDNENNRHDITIGVGVDTITIKGEK